MFKKYKDSPYLKAMTVMLLGGAILIFFSDWVKNTNFSVGFNTVSSAFAPVIIGMILAFLICPIYNPIVRISYARITTDKALTDKTRRHYLTIARTIATVICLVIVVGAVAALLYILLPQVISSTIDLVTTLPERLSTLSDWLRTHFGHFPQLAKWVDNVAELGADDIIKWLQENVLGGNAVSIATMVSTGVISAVNYVLDAVIGVLIMVYLLNYKETLFAMGRKFIAATCSKKRQDGLYEFIDIFNETFIGFIVGRIIDSTIIGVLTYFVLLVCQIPFASMIALIVGVTNVIPFFGPFIGAIPSILILMLEDPMKALWFAVIILIIQQLDGNVIGPKVVGNAIGIGSFWVLIAVLVGGGLFGFAGMAFGVPVFAVIYRYASKLTSRALNKQGKATHTADYFDMEKFGIDTSEIHLEEYKGKEKDFIGRYRIMKENNDDEILGGETVLNVGSDAVANVGAAAVANTVSAAVANTGSDALANANDEDLEAIKEKIHAELLK